MKTQRPFLALEHLLPLDATLAAAAIVVCAAALITEVPSIGIKFRAVEVFLQQREGQVQAVEEMAMTGDLAPAVVVRHASVEVPFRAARREGGMHLLWLCGARRPPPGWEAAPALADTAPGLFAVCREAAS